MIVHENNPQTVGYTPNLTNLTPHEIVIHLFDDDGDLDTIMRIPASGTVARVEMEYSANEPIDVDGIDVGVIMATPKRVEGLGPPKEGHYYIASAMVAQAVTRRDVLAPDTGPSAIRNKQGHIKAVIRLLSYAKNFIDLGERNLREHLGE